AAMRILESEGLIKPSVAGVSRQITAEVRKQSKKLNRPLRICILPYQPLQQSNSRSQNVLLQLMRAINDLGHACFISSQTHSQVENHPHRLKKLVRTMAADAWVSYTASEEVVAWFVEQQIPIICMGGHTQNLPVACTRSDSNQAMQTAIDALVQYGHRRIVLICPRYWWEPDLHPSAHAFLERMAFHGIPTSSFNKPAWEETAEGVHQLLSALFEATPPTALIALEPSVAMAAVLHLSQKGIRVPADVSVISMTEDSTFCYLQPTMTHFAWEIEPHIRRITRWVTDLARGRVDQKTTTIQASFIPGGTMGPMKRR
ncbi:MAG: substrate-binding domain-containing protein, partial [Verrucomicrobia bacterium]|nr:substrate-binding domain-containing protein [Verrucomicrobiota bacterium]